MTYPLGILPIDSSLSDCQIVEEIKKTSAILTKTYEEAKKVLCDEERDLTKICSIEVQLASRGLQPIHHPFISPSFILLVNKINDACAKILEVLESFSVYEKHETFSKQEKEKAARLQKKGLEINMNLEDSTNTARRLCAINEGFFSPVYGVGKR